MRPKIFYRIAATLLALFAVLHTIGFRQTDPAWRVDALLQSMRSTQFNVQGFTRSYWDFFVGFGLFVTVVLVFASVVAWQMSRLSDEALAQMRVAAWGFVACFAAVSVLTWRYFFVAPLVFSILITLCLGAAAWLTRGSEKF